MVGGCIRGWKLGGLREGARGGRRQGFDRELLAYTRMFFANYDRGLPLDECPDNDSHNVDTIDGLTIPAAVAAVGAARGQVDSDIVKEAVAAAGVTP